MRSSFPRLAITVLLALAAGCGTSSNNAATTTTTEATTTSSTDTSTTTTTTVDPNRKCTASDLVAVAAAGDAGAGQRYFDIRLRNNAATSCTVTGFPGLAMYNGATQVVSSVQRSNQQSSYPIIHLLHNESAATTVHYAVIPTNNETCKAVDRIIVTTPDDTQQITVDKTAVTIDSLCPKSGVSVTSLVKS